MRVLRWAGAVAAVLLALVAFSIWKHRGSEGARPSPPEEPEYVDEASCARCHADEHARWVGSHHDLAMQPADETTVLADFDDAALSVGHERWTFHAEDGRFFARTAGPDGEERDYEVAYTFGVDPLQQYLVRLDRGRYQALTVAWDAHERRWFSLYEDPAPPGDPMHWSSLQFNWNYMCADCHSTAVRKNYDPGTRSYDTTFARIDVGCQACHGPGSVHVERATRGRLRAGDSGFSVSFRDAPARSEVESCAPCHSRRDPVREGFLPGRELLDHYVPALLEEGLYFADGQIHDEVYVYGSFVQSKMHQRGVRCSDCHDPHSTRLILDGDALCTRCHQQDPPDPFVMPDPKRYDTPEHHHHAQGKPGSRCVDCHMPARTYMVIDPRRDHSFRVPRPDLASETGAPDACTGCHEDRDAAWAAARVAEWFPESRVRAAPHFARALAAGRRGDPDAAKPLSRIAGDPARPAIVRASAASLLGALDPTLAAEALELLSSSDEALLRHAAAATWSASVPPRAPEPWLRRKALALGRLLDDPVFAVRAEAARGMAEVPASLRPAASAAAFEAALDDLFQRFDLMADRPEGQLTRGATLASLGRHVEAERAYREALALDPTFDPARFNLGNLLHERGRSDEAVRVFEEIVARGGEGEGEAHYSLGLLLAELGRLEEAEVHLARAADAMPHRARVHYNLGLARQRLERPVEAESAFRAGLDRSPNDPSLLHALALLLYQQRRFHEALDLARRLEAAAPGEDAVAFRRRIVAAISGG